MDKFTASNGYTVVHGGGWLSIRNTADEPRHEINMFSTAALREFFQAEKDAELGRWRWPDNPDYVVYKDGTSRRVIRESSGSFMQVSLHDRKVMTTYLDSYVGAARAYDEAHPERKPWRDAKEGEVWIVTPSKAYTLGEQANYPAIFQAGMFRDHGGSWGAEDLTAARRIWPEVSDE